MFEPAVMQAQLSQHPENFAFNEALAPLFETYQTPFENPSIATWNDLYSLEGKIMYEKMLNVGSREYELGRNKRHTSKS